LSVALAGRHFVFARQFNQLLKIRGHRGFDSTSNGRALASCR
jgi:hypothetical protein